MFDCLTFRSADCVNTAISDLFAREHKLQTPLHSTDIYAWYQENICRSIFINLARVKGDP